MKLLLAVLIIFGIGVLNESAVVRQNSCPLICPANYAPVCGSDGVTYSNECAFHAAACRKEAEGIHITVIHRDEC